MMPLASTTGSQKARVSSATPAGFPHFGSFSLVQFVFDLAECFPARRTVKESRQPRVALTGGGVLRGAESYFADSNHKT